MPPSYSGVSYNRFQDFAFVIDSAPEVVAFTVDLHENLVDMPAPVRERTHTIHPPASDLSGDHQAKSVPPKTNRFVTDIDPAFAQQILDIPQRQREAHLVNQREADAHGARLELVEVGWEWFACKAGKP